MSTAILEIAGRRIGDGHSCFIVAEAGVNHNGDLVLAKQLIRAAREANADAVKFQTFRADELASPDAPKAEYQKRATRRDESHYEMLKRLEMSAEMHRELMAYARECGILFFSTPFDAPSADLLDELGVPVFKIPSGEITNLPLVRHIARKGKPVIVSTGMSWLREVAAAVDAIRAERNEQFALLHCTSSYPSAPEEANLRAMRTLRDAFNVPVGYSDHNSGLEIAFAAAALGAAVIEKHLTLDRNLPGPDHAASLEPKDLAALVLGVHIVESALGSGRKEPMAGEMDTAAVARRSLVAARDIPAGARLAPDMIAIRRPGTGLPPATLEAVLGRTARISIPAGALLREEMLQ